jgi:hypothetical protein
MLRDVVLRQVQALRVSHTIRPGDRIALAAPIIWMVLAATAIPIELRPHGRAPLDWGTGTSDFAENILGFVPVGIVLAEYGLLPAVLGAAAMSLLAETSQLWILYRDPQPADVAANVIGGVLGAIICNRYRIRLPDLPINRMISLAAAAMAILLAIEISVTAGDAFNTRGATTPGALEAEWRFNENTGRLSQDSSGHGLNGAFHGQVKRVPGVMGSAVQLNDVKDYIDFGHSTAMRLQGSMTITAWINPTSFPVDDAAIVSQLTDKTGYQLDTTVDNGPRTIGFKLTNTCGWLMARYGATPLVTGAWYHVAGVYDAEARTLDVYLNGRLDNGLPRGPITGSQVSSRSNIYVGHRPPVKTMAFPFAGSIDDVRIYSSALTKDEIGAVMNGKALGSLSSPRGRGLPRRKDTDCAVVISDAADRMIPGKIAVFGVLAAMACIGLWPTAGRLLGLAVSLSAGLFFFATRAQTLPHFNIWMMPLITCVGAVSVASSIKSSRTG